MWLYLSLIHGFLSPYLQKNMLAPELFLVLSTPGHRVGWDEARVLEIESNSRYRKYNESAHMTCLTNPISQPSLVIFPIWIPLISNEVSNSQ
jgi:hypothetical protein